MQSVAKPTASPSCSTNDTSATRTIQRLEQAKSENTAQIARLAERLSLSNEKVHKLHTLESLIIDLSLEVTERCEDDINITSVENQKEVSLRRRQAVLKACNNDPVLVLHNLRTALRLQFAFKEDYEAELKRTLAIAAGQSINSSKQCASALDSLKAENASVLAEKGSILSQLSKTQAAKDEISASSQAVIEQCQIELQRVTKQLRATERKLVALEQKKTEKPSDKHHSIISTTTAAAASSGSNSSTGSSTSIVSSHAKNMILAARHSSLARNSMVELNQANQQLGRVTAENVQLKIQIDALKVQISGFRQNIRQTTVTEALRDASRSKGAGEVLRSKVKALEEEVVGLRRSASSANAAVKKITADYDKLYVSYQKSQKKYQILVDRDTYKNRTLKDAEAKNLADSNPYLAQYYKAQFEASQDEVASLRGKFKQLLSVDHSNKLRLRAGEADRQRLLSLADNVRVQLEDTEEKLAKQKQKNQEDEEMLWNSKQLGRRPASASSKRDLRSGGKSSHHVTMKRMNRPSTAASSRFR